MQLVFDLIGLLFVVTLPITVFIVGVAGVVGLMWLGNMMMINPNEIKEDQ